MEAPTVEQVPIPVVPVVIQPEKKKRGRKPKPKPLPEDRFKILIGDFVINFND